MLSKLKTIVNGLTGSGDTVEHRMQVDLLTLKFAGPDHPLERQFLEYYSFRSLGYTRFTLVMGALLIGLFGILDAYVMPQHVHFLWFIRFAILCPAVLLVALSTYVKRLVPRLPFFQVIMLLLTAGGFTVMILFSPAPVNYLYYSGLIQVLIFGYTFLRLRFIWGTLAGWLIVCIYLFAAGRNADVPLPILINNIFFLVSTNFIGMMVSYSIEYFARNDFYLMKKMKHAQEEMENANALLETRVKDRTVELRRNNEQLKDEIADRKRLEQQLIQSQKLEGVGTLAGGIAHEFNNLLAMVLGSAELLKHHLQGHPELQKYVDRIIDSSERGTSISRQLLIFSRPDQAELKPIPVSQTIAELKEMLKHFLPKSITVNAETSADTGIIMADAGQIHQALLNLALNAGDAMKDGGQITIREFSVDAEHIRNHFSLGECVGGSYIGISVQDTGTGMDEKTRLRIFDPFFTTKPPGKGTGLGLGIVHGIVKNHNGVIDVESTPGAGTTFTLYFPAVATGRPVTAAAAPAPPVPKRTGSILVVDDEPLLREMLFEFLNGIGYTVHMASNGHEALEFLRAADTTIDLVITDLGMPEMGGQELYTRLRQFNAGVKVMISSGYLDGATREHLLGLGISGVIQKPYRLAAIREEIITVLETSRV